MRQVSNELEIFSGDSLPKVNFTMDTTKDITATSHGLLEGSVVRLTTTGTLPAGLSLLTDYYVVKIVDSNTINISLEKDGEAITSTDAGTGTHTINLIGNVFKVYDYRHIILSAFSSDSFNGTVKVQISNQKNVNFSNASSKNNRWSYVQLKDLSDASTINGAVGIASAGTDLTKNYELNTNGFNYLCANYTAWTAGKLSLIAVGFSN